MNEASIPSPSHRKSKIEKAGAFCIRFRDRGLWGRWLRHTLDPPHRILTGDAAGSLSLNVDAFRQGMRDLGYVGDKNVVIEDRFTESGSDRSDRARVFARSLSVSKLT